ncbi:GNAT family N-acetyltransferase [Agaribacterium haliotis]|uniref:GNAT family N-acetyltransferase n=1 Tax=Agaribacterium haliotis TaxID=2013869 RepID=UPI000BB593B8|nr:GNAT family N-acetyltransferase [Agaribacterium haliotis]
MTLDTKISVQIVDYNNSSDSRALLALLEQYALDPMGGASPLPEHTRASLCKKLAERSDALSLIAWAGDEAVGLVNAFEGFSTFAAQALINVHDVYIKPEYRGRGVLEQIFQRLDTIATQRNCCKLTLEVLANNQRAQAAYRKLGFGAYELADSAGQALFWQKKL